MELPQTVKTAVTHFALRCVSGVRHLLRMAQNLHPSSPVIATVLCCAIGATAATGAEARKKSYDVPGGDAATTLAQFARNSGDQIVYLVENVHTEKTQPVRGEFTAIEAVRQMLTGTALFAVQDEATGALVVSRRRPEPAQKPEANSAPARPAPAGPAAAPPERPPISQPKASVSSPMKNRTALTFLVGWLFASVAAEAQTTGTIEGRVQSVVTGQYLNNARVSVQGTALSSLTDESGTFRIAQLPMGPAVLEVFYTGLDPLLVPVQITGGGTVVQDVGLTNVARYGRASDAVKLDPFVVSTARETNAAAIAINEQRFAPNLKTVVSTDAFGDVTDGNVGEFLKFLPGIATNNEDGQVGTISIRGFEANQTRITSDGAELANTGVSGAKTRDVSFGQVSINNLARVEVIKSPTAADPADTVGGTINFVTKSAFERRSAELAYNVSFSANSRDVSARREPTVGDRMIHKMAPGFTFDYTLPVNRNFGLVVTGQHSDRYVQATEHRMLYSTAAAAGASPGAPFLSELRFADAARLPKRQSLGLKADWRLAANSVLSVSVQTSGFLTTRSPIQMTIQPGATVTPNPVTGKRMTSGPDFVSGATGRGVVRMLDSEDIQQVGRIRLLNTRYRFDNGTWKVDADFAYSLALGSYRDINAKPPRFQRMITNFAVPVRVELRNIDENGPRSIKLFDNNEQELSLYDIRNYRLVDARQNSKDYADTFKRGRVDLRRRLNLFSFPFAVQVGASGRSQTRDVRHYNTIWNYTGPADLSYLAHTQYKTRGDPNFDPIQWLSTMKAWAAFQADRTLFTLTPAQVVAAATFSITNSLWVQENVDAQYGEVDLRPFPRLSILAGVRREGTTLEAYGPWYDPSAVWVRNANGSFAHNAAGQRLRRPDAGAMGSLEEVALTRKDRGAHAGRSYDGYYPSAHATYNITANILARASFAETYGRPNFTEIVPTTTATELDLTDDPTKLGGRLTVRNPGLKPWAAKNYDVSLEYYTPHGGLCSVGAFRKDVRGFFVNETHLVTEQDLQAYELGSNYLGWEITSRTNGGNTRLQGVEFNLQHSLQPLGKWGRPFEVFVNGSRLTQDGNQRTSFGGFAPRNLNWGASFTNKRFRVLARWNQVADRFQSLITNIGTNGSQYIVAKTTLDVNAEVRLTPWLSAYANCNNLLNAADKLDRYADETPVYARRYQVVENGTLITFGVKGRF